MVPLPDYAAALETRYARAGQLAEARKQRDFVDAIDKMAFASGEKTNRNLALVESEIAVRPDVYTYDALSWLLFKFRTCRTDCSGARGCNGSRPVSRGS